MLFSLLVLASGVSPVAKVLELLQHMERKLEEDGEVEGELFTKFIKWSQKEQGDARSTITQTTNEVNDAEAFLDEQKSFRDDMTAEVETVIGEIARIEADRQNATDVRANERKDFEAADADRAKALQQVGLAIETLQKSPASFLQQSVVARLRDSVATRDGLVAELLSKAGSKDEILDLLHSLEEETSQDRDAGLTGEQKSQNDFEVLEQSLKAELASATELKADKQRQISSSEEASSAKQQELANAKRLQEETKTYLSNLMVDSNQKTAEYKAANGLRSDELTAIQEAVAILTSERAMSVFSSELTLAPPRVQKLALPASVSLVQVRRIATSGPFDKVKDMIHGMIEKLSSEAADAADHHAFCEEETAKTRKSLASKEKEVTKLGSRLEARNAAIDEYTTRSAEIEEETGNMNTAVADATSLRQDEEGQAERAVAEYGDAVTIIGQAKQVLQDVFDEKGTEGSAIIGILEVAMSDFAKLKTEAETQEAAAKADFTKLTDESKVRAASLKSEMESVTRMKLETESDQQHLVRELDSVKTEVEAVQDYWAKLKPQCTTKTPSHEERAERRQQQLDGLTNALGVLKGEAMA